MEKICRKLFKSKQNKKQEGITLIALIITVVVMLILAGVAIATIVDGDGLFSKTRQATEVYNNSANDEKSKISEFIEWIDNHLGSKDIKLSYKTEKIDKYSTKIDLKTKISDELLKEISTPISYEAYAQKELDKMDAISYEEYAQEILNGITSTEEKEIMFIKGFNYNFGTNYSSIEDIYIEFECNSLEELSSQMRYSSVDEMLIGEYIVNAEECYVPYYRYVQEILNGITSTEEKENIFVEGINYIWQTSYNSIEDIYIEFECNSLEELSSKMGFDSVDEMLIGEHVVKLQEYQEFTPKFNKIYEIFIEGFNNSMGTNYNSIEELCYVEKYNSTKEMLEDFGYNSIKEMLIGEQWVKPEGYDFENNCRKPILYVNGILERGYGADTLDSYIYIASTNGDYVFTVVVGNMSKSITVNVAGLEKIEYSHIYIKDYYGEFYAIDTEGNLYQFDIGAVATNYTNTHVQPKRVLTDVKVKEILGYNYIYGQDNKIYKYDSVNNTLVLQLEGMELQKSSDSSYFLNEAGEVYSINSDEYGGIQKEDYGELRFKDANGRLGLTVSGEIYELYDMTKISGELKAKEIDPSDQFITEDGDLYYYSSRLEQIEKVNDESVKFKQFYYDYEPKYYLKYLFNYDYIMTENGDLYEYDNNSVTSIGINVNNVKKICEEVLILNDGSIYVNSSYNKDFENAANNQKINVKQITSGGIIDEENNVYIWHNSKLIKLDIKGKNIISSIYDASYVLVGIDNKVYNVDCSGEDVAVNLITNEIGSGHTDLDRLTNYVGCIWINENNEVCLANASTIPN